MISTLEQEKRKYWRIWKRPEYRTRSPAERVAEYFVFATAREPGDTMIDLGAGTGRAMAMIRERLRPKTRVADCPISFTLFDIVDVNETTLPLIEGTIWDLSALPVFDWIFCTDVLEHVPPEYVNQTLAGMARITRKGGLLTIAHFAASTGDFPDVEVIEDLHLTIEPPEWWRAKIEQHWHVREWTQQSPIHSRVLLGEPCLKN